MIARRRGRYVLTPELARRRVLAAAMYRQGYKYEEIAERLGISLASVHRDMVRSQTPRRTPWQMQERVTPYNRAVAAAYAAARDSGGTLKSVGEQFGISEQVASHHVRKVRKLG